MKGILCFGDSITFGKGEQPCVGWVGRLKDYFEPKGDHNGVYNLGISGNTSTDLLKRFDVECQSRIKLKRSRDKYIILIAIGTNDCKFDGKPSDNNPRTTSDQFGKNIKELITKAKAYQAELIFMGLPPVDQSRTLPFEETWFDPERVKLFDSTVKELCEKNNVLFLDIFGKLNDEKWPQMLLDGLHPNSQGYEKIYELIKEFLIEKEII
jgi:lysophospholipase L1-like esterase